MLKCLTKALKTAGCVAEELKLDTVRKEVKPEDDETFLKFFADVVAALPNEGRGVNRGKKDDSKNKKKLGQILDGKVSQAVVKVNPGAAPTKFVSNFGIVELLEAHFSALELEDKMIKMHAKLAPKKETKSLSTVKVPKSFKDLLEE